MKKTLQLLFATLLTTSFSNAQTVGDTFTVNDLDYEVINIAPNEVMVTGTQSATLTDVNIPSSVTDMATSALYDVTIIGESAFAGNTIIETLVTPSTLTAILPDSDGNLGNFRDCSALLSADLSASTLLTELTGPMFRNAGSLADIHLPSGITNLGGNVFRDIAALPEVAIDALVPPVADSGLFNGITLANLTLVVPNATAVTAYEMDAYWTQFGTITDGSTLSTDVSAISGFAMFPNPTSLSYVNILSANNANISVSVFDILGKEVVNATVTNRLDVSALKSGVYIVKAAQEGNVSTSKLVVK